MNDYNFGNFLYELRIQKGLSQSDLGKIMGVSNKAVSKWEMGVSKPRPDMLVTLSSFFGVTVDELLAGKRNEQNNQEYEERHSETALKSWTDEYKKKKKRGVGAIITACFLPVLLFVVIGVIVGSNSEDKEIGPIITIVIFFMEAIDIALIFVFFGSARRLKRMLYAIYPDQTEQISAMISPKKERRPLSKTEKIFVIMGYSIAFVANLIRVIILACASQNTIIKYIDIALLLFASVAFLMEFIIWTRYAIKNHRKKQ